MPHSITKGEAVNRADVRPAWQERLSWPFAALLILALSAGLWAVIGSLLVRWL